MVEKSCPFPWRDSNLYIWDTGPTYLRLHHGGRHASRQSKQTLQTLTRQLHCETQSWKETLQLLSSGPQCQAPARTSAESDEACQRKTKDRAVCECVCVCVCVRACMRNALMCVSTRSFLYRSRTSNQGGKWCCCLHGTWICNQTTAHTLVPDRPKSTTLYIARQIDLLL